MGTALTWESFLQCASSGNWDETTFQERTQELDLPLLSSGVPVLVQCQVWQEDIALILRNFLPLTEVFWVNGREIFLFASPESSGNASLKNLQTWAETLIHQIHSMLADELGVLSNVYVGTIGKGGLWHCYLELGRLALLHKRFFPGEAGLALWQAGFSHLFHSLEPEPIERYCRNILGDKLSLELRETLKTYFRTGLSLTETAALLFIHRNTLIYRLDRITELTGYNPREFNQAISLFLAFWLERG